jgi:MFS family permease
MGASFWRLWTSGAMSNLADGVAKVAIPLVAIGFTRSPTLIAGLTLAFTLPWLLFSLPAGAVVDRVDRRLLMLAANVVRSLGLAVLLLALATDLGSIWLLYLVALIAGTAETFYETASQAVVPQMVRPDQLMRANAWLYAVEMSSLELIGPPLAGFLMTVAVGAAVGSPVVLWAGAVFVLLMVRGSFKVKQAEATERVTLRGDVAEGLRVLTRQKLLRAIMVMTGVFNLASSATFAIFVLYAVGPDSPMGLTQTQYGWLLSSVAAGCLVGSFLAEPVSRLVGRPLAIAGSYLFGGLLVGIPAFTTDAVVIGVVFFIGGIGMVIGNVTTLSLRQVITPPRLLGRVSAGHRLVSYGTKPLGALAGGVLAQFLGMRAVFAIMGLLAVAALAGMTQLTRPEMEAAERAAREAE